MTLKEILLIGQPFTEIILSITKQTKSNENEQREKDRGIKRET